MGIGADPAKRRVDGKQAKQVATIATRCLGLRFDDPGLSGLPRTFRDLADKLPDDGGETSEDWQLLGRLGGRDNDLGADTRISSDGLSSDIRPGGDLRKPAMKCNETDEFPTKRCKMGVLK